jgi:hypothetical protein
MALAIQSEGRANNQLRKTKAYADISAARYQDGRRNFTFAQYVALHQHTYNKLFDLGEPIPVTKQVMDFLAGINAPEMTTAKQIVMGDKARLELFDLKQTNLANFAIMQQTLNRASRNVSEVQTCKGRGGKGNTQHGSSTKPIHAGTHTPQGWSDLSFAERDEVRTLRQQTERSRERQ